MGGITASCPKFVESGLIALPVNLQTVWYLDRLVAIGASTGTPYEAARAARSTARCWSRIVSKQEVSD
jgi:hypothetical protein